MLRDCVPPLRKIARYLVLSQKLCTVAASLQRTVALRLQVIHLKLFYRTVVAKLACSVNTTSNAFMKKRAPKLITRHLVMLSTKSQLILFAASLSIFSFEEIFNFSHQMLRSKDSETTLFLVQLSQNHLIKINAGASLAD